jgi:hypothetical protein
MPHWSSLHGLWRICRHTWFFIPRKEWELPRVTNSSAVRSDNWDVPCCNPTSMLPYERRLGSTLVLPVIRVSPSLGGRHTLHVRLVSVCYTMPLCSRNGSAGVIIRIVPFSNTASMYPRKVQILRGRYVQIDTALSTKLCHYLECR